MSICYCGAPDCRTCHPENYIDVECPGCGEQTIILALDEEGLCPECSGKVAICPECGDTYDKRKHSTCPGCAECWEELAEC